jgi:prepilin-type N-terminal cleavage/methylation domain-containing protein
MSITKKNKQKGFTLIELMVGIAIVGLLSSVILVATKGSTNKANIAKTMQWSRSIESLLGPYAVGIWNFDEGSGTTVSDLSGYGNDGTLVNNPTWRCAEDDSDYTPSGQGCALEFDGSSNYVEIPNPLDQLNLEQSWSVLAWVNIRDTDYTQNLIAGMNRNLELVHGISDKLLLYLNSGDNDYYIYSDEANLLTNQGWKYVTFIFRNEDGYRRIYVNGENHSGGGPNKTSTPAGLSSTFRIGDDTLGLIDDVRIYETALTSAQVEALYYAGLENLYNKGLIGEQEYQERVLAGIK